MSVRARVMRLAMQASRFAVLQVLLQASSAVIGIFLVWVMAKRDYALYTVAAQFTGAFAVLSDSGVVSSVLALGGRRWPDLGGVGAVMAAALKIRRRLGLAYGALLVPLIFWIMSKQSIPIVITAVLAAIVFVNAMMQLTTDVLDVVPRLAGDFVVPQRADLAGALVRIAALGLLFALPGVPINAVTVTAITLGGTCITVVFLRRYVASRMAIPKTTDPGDLHNITALMKSQMAGAIFYCVQGQIGMWLIAFSGKTGSIADLGALSRLSVAFNVVTAAMTLVIVPRISKSQNRAALMRNMGVAVAVQLLVSTAALLAAWRLPDLILLILGPKYHHLRTEVFFMILLSVAYSTISTLWLINSSRGWVKHSWINIPLVIGTQLLVAPRTDFSTVKGVLIFNTLSVLPGIALNLVLLLAGLKRAHHEFVPGPAAAEP